MNRVFQYRLYPTCKQTNLLTEMLRDHCALYNAALEERKSAYAKDKTRIKYGEQTAQLTQVRAADEQYSRWSSASEQQTLRRLDNTYNNMFNRWEKTGKPSHIRYKTQYRFSTVTFKQGDGGKVISDTKKVYMQGVGHVKLNLHRPIRGRVKQFSITRKGKHWFVNVMCDNVPKQERPLTGKKIGIDKGINHLLADSDGGFYENPRFGKKREKKLALAQQNLSRKKKGSKRYRKAAARVGAHHRKTANRRRDYHHNLSRKVVDTYDLTCMEGLNIPNMTRSAKGTIDSPGVNVAAKSGLNKSILDASWGVLTRMIIYKAEEAGVKTVPVDARNTSITCYACGHVEKENRVGEQFRCLKCGHADHADTNAAKNILRLGLGLCDAATLEWLFSEYHAALER